jgi:type II secretory pathway component GspD/PulD (secretin)
MINRSLRALCLVPVALAAGVVLGGAPASAQLVRQSNTLTPGSMGIPQPEPKITLSVQKRSLSRILAEVFKQAPYDYKVVADVGATAFDLDVKQVPLTQALNQLLAQDKRPDPLVFYFTKNPTGQGTFTIDREFLELVSETGEKRVSLANARITKVLPQVFKLMGVQARIEPDVPPVTISLQVRPQDWSQVLPQVILSANAVEPTLTYSMDGDTYVVHLHKTHLGLTATGAAVPGVRKVQLALTDAPLRDAITAVLKDSAWKYQVSDNVKDVAVSYSASAEPELSALSNILKQAGELGPQITYREGKGVLYIEPGPLPGAATVPVKGEGALATATLDVKQERLKAVIARIENQTGTTIRIAPTVPDLPITLKLDKARVDGALRAVMMAVKASLPNLTYRQMGTTYFVELAK